MSKHVDAGKILLRMTEIHGAARRIVIINCYDTDADGKSQLVTNNEYRVFSRLMREEYATPMNFEPDQWFGSGATSFNSADGCVMIYFNGLKDAMLNHWDEIINFLSE